MTDLTPEALAILAGGAAPPKRGGLLATVGTVAALTVVAAGGGWALGTFLGAKEVAPPAAEPAAGPEPSPAPAAVQSTLVDLEPVTSDISSPPGTQMRLKASLVLKPGSSADAALLGAQVQADTVVFVRSLELAQVEGSRGLLHLKEDLLERARLRSPDIEDILIHALVVK